MPARHDQNAGDFDDLRPLFEMLSSLSEKLEAIEKKVSATNGHAEPVMPERQFYTTAEFAAKVGRAEYTARQWCLNARINAVKAGAGRGVFGEWRISHAELNRYLNEGLLPRKRRGGRGGSN